MKIQGKVAIVTCGASGIGYALVAALVRRQCHVTLDDVDAESA
jgi:NAD(P)-dependent dehydrogenase (short-subunit alcohol dehydrogenase family)